MISADQDATYLDDKDFDAKPETPDGFGPFDPPADYEFEPELQGPPPRPVPAVLRKGPYGRSQRAFIWTMLVVGTLLALCGLLPFVQFWGLFFVPLKYLTWIGLAAVAMAAAAFVGGVIDRGPYRYVQEGIPLVARIRDLTLEPTSVTDGNPTGWAYAALIEYQDPENGEVLTTETKTREISNLVIDGYTTSYRVGDYVTAVYLRSNPADSLRLYGFLGLRKGVGLVRRVAEVTGGPLANVLAITQMLAFFGVLIWSIIAVFCYWPLEPTLRAIITPFVAGGLVLGIGLLVGMRYDLVRARRRRERRNREALEAGGAVELEAGEEGWFGVRNPGRDLLMIVGAFILGGLVSLSACFTANVVLDRSKGNLQSVEIDEFVTKTRCFCINEYAIKYHWPGNAKTHRLSTTPDHMNQFQSDRGLAELHPGWLGWPWVKTIRPVEPAALQPQPAHHRDDDWLPVLGAEHDMEGEID
jgi:hypothetical protein